MNANLYDVLLPHAPVRRDEIVLTTDTNAVWRRGDLETLSGSIAALLQTAGVQPGDRVAAQIEKSAEAVCLYLACLKVGAVYLPLNVAYTNAELAHFLGDAEPVVFIKSSDDALLPVGARRGKVFTLKADGTGNLVDEARACTPLGASVHRQSDDLAAFLYTSGTTGRSKGAMITHGNLAFMAEALKEAWEVTDKDVLLHALPVFHAHGLFIALNTALVAGTPMHFLQKFDLDAIVVRLPSSTVFMGVPTFYSRMNADSRINQQTCRNIRLFISGSAPLSVPTFETFQHKTGHAILERYAMTETTVITTNPLHGERVPGTVGFALPDVRVEVIDERGDALPRGEIGEVALTGPNVFKGYWRLPEVTKSEFTATGYFKTGDLGRMDAGGRVSIVGRNKDLIITGGYNVYPGEVEAVLAKIDGVADCAVIGVPHADFGEGVVAVLERGGAGGNLTAESVMQAIAPDMAKYKLPKAIVFVDAMPRNAMGKVQKNTLRSTHASLLNKALT